MKWSNADIGAPRVPWSSAGYLRPPSDATGLPYPCATLVALRRLVAGLGVSIPSYWMGFVVLVAFAHNSGPILMVPFLSGQADYEELPSDPLAFVQSLWVPCAVIATPLARRRVPDEARQHPRQLPRDTERDGERGHRDAARRSSSSAARSSRSQTRPPSCSRPRGSTSCASAATAAGP
jgi:hypothetical protein